MELRLESFQKNKSNIKEELLKEILFYSLLKNWSEKNKIPHSQITLTKKERLLFAKNKEKLKALKNLKLHIHLKQALLKELEKKLSEPPLKQKKLFYKKHRPQFKQAAQCQLDQILVDNQKLAQKLYSRIKAGEPFSRLSRHYSLKKAPGWVKKGQWPLFDHACFKEKDSLSSVLKSPYGWHIFLRKGEKKARQKSFSESQKEISKILKKQALPLQLESWLKQESLKTPFYKDKKLLDQIKIQYKKELI